MSTGPAPRQQIAWDARAAANFMAGGAGSGLVLAAALALLAGTGPRWPLLLGAALVAAGLAAVWAEIGRPWRALNVFFNPRTSWMTREALAAPPLLLLALVAALLPPAPAAAAALLAAVAALAFVYCQGCILRAARGIPTWREPAIVPLIVATALAEGAGLWLLLGGSAAGQSGPVWLGFGAALAARQWAWLRWRARVQAAPRARSALDAAGRILQGTTLLPLAMAVLALGAPLPPAAVLVLQGLAGALALAGGAWFKLVLVTRAAYTQGFAIPVLPVRGARRREA